MPFGRGSEPEGVSLWPEPELGAGTGSCTLPKLHLQAAWKGAGGRGQGPGLRAQSGAPAGGKPLCSQSSLLRLLGGTSCPSPGLWLGQEEHVGHSVP